MFLSFRPRTERAEYTDLKGVAHGLLNEGIES